MKGGEIAMFIKGLDVAKAKELLWDSFNDYIRRGYEIVFEADGEGVKCQILSSRMAVTSTGENWMEAFKKATENLSHVLKERRKT